MEIERETERERGSQDQGDRKHNELKGRMLAHDVPLDR